MFRWRLYYDDGSTYSDTDGPPHTSPVWGAVGVVQPGYDPPVMGQNADWLMYRDDRWEECGADGIEDHAAHFGHLIACWRKTRWIPRPVIRDLWLEMRQAANECE